MRDNRFGRSVSARLVFSGSLFRFHCNFGPDLTLSPCQVVSDLELHPESCTVAEILTFVFSQLALFNRELSTVNRSTKAAYSPDSKPIEVL